MPTTVVILYKRKVRRLVARRELRPALEALAFIFEFVEEMEAAEDEVTLVASRLTGAEADKAKGVMGEEAYRIELNKVSSAILSITNRYF